MVHGVPIKLEKSGYCQQAGVVMLSSVKLAMYMNYSGEKNKIAAFTNHSHDPCGRT